MLISAYRFVPTRRVKAVGGIYDIFFSNSKKIATYLIFPSIWRLVV